MNKHFTGKLFLTLLLIFSLCADISMPAYASDAFENTQTDDPSASNTSTDDTSTGSSSDGDSSDENTNSGNAGSGNTGTENTNSGNTGSGNTNSGNTGSENTNSGNTNSGASSGSNPDKTPDKNTSDKDSSQGSTSEQDSITDNALSEDIQADDSEDLSEHTEEALTPAAVAGETTFITLSAAGDCTLGIDSRYSHNFNKYYKKKGDSYFFKKVKSVFSSDDITIVNFEELSRQQKSAPEKHLPLKVQKICEYS